MGTDAHVFLVGSASSRFVARRDRATVAAVLVAWAVLSGTASGGPSQGPPGADTGAQSAEAQATAQQDRIRDPSEPDFAVITLPTTLRVPRHGLAFRMTHRFSRPLAQGDVGDLFDDFLGLDSAAQVGLEFRYGLMPGTQIGIHRTNEKTIQIFGQQDLVQQRNGKPFSVNVLVSMEGLRNLSEQHSAGIGVLVSRKLGSRGAVYAEPIWVGNTNFLPDEGVDDDQTIMVGLGTRLRVRPTVYLLAQMVPRLAGHRPGSHAAAFGIEKRAGGHSFQFNISNSLGTTPGQMARGAGRSGDWFIGFNLSRRFF